MNLSGKLYGKQLDRVMQEDMDNLIQEEMREYDRGARRGTAKQPVYMEEDYFKEKKRESEMKRIHRQGWSQ